MTRIPGGALASGNQNVCRPVASARAVFSRSPVSKCATTVIRAPGKVDTWTPTVVPVLGCFRVTDAVLVSGPAAARLSALAMGPENWRCAHAGGRRGLRRPGYRPDHAKDYEDADDTDDRGPHLVAGRPALAGRLRRGGCQDGPGGGSSAGLSQIGRFPDTAIPPLGYRAVSQGRAWSRASQPNVNIVTRRNDVDKVHGEYTN